MERPVRSSFTAVARCLTAPARAAGWLLPIAAFLTSSAAHGTALTEKESQELAAYGQLPAFDRLCLSPDGSRLAYVGALGDQVHVIIKSLADGRKLLDFTPARGQKIRSLQWADNDHLLTGVSMTTTVSLLWQGECGEYFGIIAADVGSGQAWDVLAFKGGVANNAGRINLAAGPVRARQIAGEIWLYVSGFFASGAQYEARGQMMKINLVKRTHEIIENSTRWTVQYDRLLDENGDEVAVSAYDQEGGRWRTDVGAGGHLQKALSGEAQIDVPRLQGISPDGKNVWLLTRKDAVTSAVTVALADGRTVEHDAASDAVHRTAWRHVIRDRRNDRIVGGVVGEGPRTGYEFLDPQLAQQWRQIEEKLGGRPRRFVSASDDFARVIVSVDSPAGPQYLLADLRSAQLLPLGPEYRWLPAVAEVRALEYPAADGLVIPGFLTLPVRGPREHMPLVVLPHGGPEARNEGGFDWWAQALANAGYAVLQPNFRGSTVSDELLAAGYGQWGRKMQTDLSDGVHYLARQGLIDPARVCIVGASYGGYAALAGVSLQQGIYRCAVAVAGLSDLHWIVKTSAGLRLNTNIRTRSGERWLGVSDVGDPSIDERSPLRHADGVSVPVLLIHGRDDTVVPYEQSRRMADALARLHKPVEMVDLKSEDHWLSRSETRLQMLAATVAFLKRQNPPELAASAAAPDRR
jgi:dipeptidyl aminopeptidase/acylaminoacyl peptidase